MSTADAPLARAPRLSGAPPRLLVVQAPYYSDVVAGLLTGASRILDEAGATHAVLSVAGAYELPQAIRLALPAGFDGYIALGCIIRGETDHYDYICAATMHGLMQVALAHALCLGAGLLTVDNLDQAVARSGPDGHNKGAEAAVAALLQIDAARLHGTAHHAR